MLNQLLQSIREFFSADSIQTGDEAREARRVKALRAAIQVNDSGCTLLMPDFVLLAHDNRYYVYLQYISPRSGQATAKQLASFRTYTSHSGIQIVDVINYADLEWADALLKAAERALTAQQSREVDNAEAEAAAQKLRELGADEST